jgi:hypothetical protein
VAASYGTQQQVNVHIEQAIVDYAQTETPRLAKAMPHKDLTVTQDETFTDSLCLIAMDPESNFIILEQLAQARDQIAWNACMAPALAQFNCRVMQSTSDEAPGLLTYVEHYLEAHHSPDLFHMQHELVKAVSGPMATKERAAQKAVSEATAQLARLQSDSPSAGDEPAKHGPEIAIQEPRGLEHAEQAFEAASREYTRLATQRAAVKASIQGIGHAYHFVDLERGVRRNGQLIAVDMQGHIEQMRTIAQQEGLSLSSLAGIDKAEGVVPKMQATIEFVSRYVRQQVAQLDVPPPVSFAMHAKVIPSYYLDRVAQTQNVSDGARLRAPLFADGGVLSALSPEAQARLHSEAKRLAAVFQRSSSNVEGRNGYLSLRSHQLRGLDLPRKRERFFVQKPRAMFAAILDAVELAPAPLSPPRRA